MKQAKVRRRRGVALTPIGLKRLQSAILSVEMTENKGNHLSLEQLGNRINVSTKTVSRLWSLNVGVDQKTLKLCFSAFNLELHKEDYTDVLEANETDTYGLSSLEDYTGEDSSQYYEENSFVKKYQQAEQIENLCSYPV
jgi:transcriptional regulator with XRE-family HTH domain